MDYDKLAELLFPNLPHDMYYYTDNYIPRNLRPGAQVTRFAPSPTGWLHIGHLLGALIDRLVATQTGGVFYLRLEDTDPKRYVVGSEDEKYNMLQYFGIAPDEGYRGRFVAPVGNYGSYVQSERTDIYKAFAKELVKRGRAFPCFCNKAEDLQEIKERREEELKSADTLEGHDECRNLTYQQIEANIKAGKPWALRLLSTGDPDKTFTYVDAIKGKRTVHQNNKDIVLIKSDGIPPYAMAHAVDDTLMGTTLVVRGEEWYPSVAAHIELFDALGLPHITYAHTPVICKLDEETGGKRKFSKRKDPESQVKFYLEKGYPTTSVLEYLLNLLNSEFEPWRNSNPDKPFEDFPFSVKNIGSNNPMFDLEKLNNISKNVISKYSPEKIFDCVCTWALQYDPEFHKHLVKNKDKWVTLFGIDRINTPRPRKDIYAWSMVKELYIYIFKKQFNCQTKPEERLCTDAAKAFIMQYANSYDANVDKDTWYSQIKEVAANFGFVSMKEYKENPTAFAGNIADACGLVRLAITGANASPDLYSIMQLVGKDECVRRLTNYANKIKK